MTEEIKNLKKIELHLHLDGSVRKETISELSGLNLEFVKENMIVPESCQDLTDYLSKFDLPLKYMQTKENLIRISRELLEDLDKDNVIYAEVRFAPIKHTKEGLTLEEIVLSVLTGLLNNKIKIKLILCMMRDEIESENIKVIEVAKKYNLALDLAGDEKNYPNELFTNLFKNIFDNNLKLTIHAGEAREKESIISALNFGAKRLGHGINIENDRDLILRLKREKTLLEICPTSNVDTKAVIDIKHHPIYKYYKEGLQISINTDNRTVSNTSLNREYMRLVDNFNLTIDDFKSINLMALKAAFLSVEEKEDILHKLEY